MWLCFSLSVDWQLCTTSHGWEQTLYIVSGFGRDSISTFKPHCFKVIRNLICTHCLFLFTTEYTLDRGALSISLFIDPARPLLNQIISPSTSVLISLSFSSLLTASLYSFVASLHSSLLIYLSVRATLPLLHLCFYPSVWICLSLGDMGPVKSITSPHPCPLATYRFLSPSPCTPLAV